jgi:hypothetical protein
LDRVAGIEALNGQRGQFILGALLGAHKTLQVSFNRQTFSVSSGSQFSFQLRMDADAHGVANLSAKL